MEVHFNMNNEIHVANHTNQDIYVMVLPNKDWLKVDLATDILMTAIWPPAFVRGIKSAFDVVNLLRCATGMGFKAYSALATSSKEHQAKFAKDAQAARDAIKGHAVKVAPQSSELVNDKAMGKAIVALASFAGVYGGHDIVLKDLMNQKDPLKHLLSYTDIINPSTFSSVISAVSDMTMIVATADFSKLTAINTNSDHSWIVTDDMIVRAKYGKLNVEDRDAGYHWFKKQKGMALSGAKGEFLAPDECLEVNVATGKFVLLYEKTGELVFYDDTGDQPKRVWGTGTAGQRAWRTYAQDDGNLVVYRGEGRPVWTLWKHMPAGHEDAHIGLVPMWEFTVKTVARTMVQGFEEAFQLLNPISSIDRILHPKKYIPELIEHIVNGSVGNAEVYHFYNHDKLRTKVSDKTGYKLV